MMSSQLHDVKITSLGINVILRGVGGDVIRALDEIIYNIPYTSFNLKLMFFTQVSSNYSQKKEFSKGPICMEIVPYSCLD